jgi:hypothetical protein
MSTARRLTLPRLAAHRERVQEVHDVERELRDIRRLLGVADQVSAGGIEKRAEEYLPPGASQMQYANTQEHPTGLR